MEKPENKEKQRDKKKKRTKVKRVNEEINNLEKNLKDER